MKLDPLDIKVIGEVMYQPRESRGKLFYLDTKKGAVTPLSKKLFTAVLTQDNGFLGKLPEHEREDALVAQAILSDEGGRFMEIPEIEPVDEFYWMAYFSEMVFTPGIEERLRKAVDVSKAIAKFRRILEQSPEDEELWRFFLEQKKTEEARAWLEELNVARDGELA